MLTKKVNLGRLQVTVGADQEVHAICCDLEALGRRLR